MCSVLGLTIFLTPWPGLVSVTTLTNPRFTSLAMYFETDPGSLYKLFQNASAQLLGNLYVGRSIPFGCPT
jgi:hypothetical protein